MTIFDITKLEQDIQGKMDVVKGLPSGEYAGVIVPEPNFTLREGESPSGQPYLRAKKDPKPDEDPNWYCLDYWIQAQDPGNPAIDGKCMVWRCFLDIDEATGQISQETGKNPRLARLREAIGQNNAGEPWNPRRPIGSPLRFRVGERVAKDGSGTFADIVSVSPA